MGTLRPAYLRSGGVVDRNLILLSHFIVIVKYFRYVVGTVQYYKFTSVDHLTYVHNMLEIHSDGSKTLLK